MAVDYSLYFVTDSTPAILGHRDLCSVVEAAVKGGVTIVQYRDKTSDTRVLIDVASKLHEITKRHAVPLLINDRVDVALAVGCEGVHIGQDDIDLASARKLLGENAIIGVTACNIQEAKAAIDGGANYLGLGTVYATATKANAKSIIGPIGLQKLLGAIADHGKPISTVCIGGINASNAQRVLYQSRHAKKSVDGIAVVSALVTADDPKETASDLRVRITQPPPFAALHVDKPTSEVASLVAAAPEIARRLSEMKPLCHNMTNLVVQNFAANVALSIGGSPIMSNNGVEAPDLAALNGSLVINMGTVTPDSIKNYVSAVTAYNAKGNPVLFDPVGGGATAVRREAVQTLLRSGYFDVIKGNESEIQTVLGEQEVVQHGVDSGSSKLTGKEKALIVKTLAAREHNVVLMTGATDYLSDGNRTYGISNGHAFLGDITGSGCTVGTTVAAFVAVERSDKLLAALSGLLMYEIAAEQAAASPNVAGTGTFISSFLDKLYSIREQTKKGDFSWAQAAKVELIDV